MTSFSPKIATAQLWLASDVGRGERLSFFDNCNLLFVVGDILTENVPDATCSTGEGQLFVMGLAIGDSISDWNNSIGDAYIERSNYWLSLLVQWMLH